MNPQWRAEDFEVLVRVAQELRRTGASRTLASWQRDAAVVGGPAYAVALEAAAKVSQRLAHGKLADSARG